MADAELDAISVSIHLRDFKLADEIDAWLWERDARDVRRLEERGAFDVLPIVIASVISLTSIASLGMWIRARTHCQVVIDVTGDVVRKEVDCRVRDGRIILITREHARIQIIDAPPMMDLSKVIRTAMTGNADDVIAAVKADGAHAEMVPG